VVREVNREFECISRVQEEDIESMVPQLSDAILLSKGMQCMYILDRKVRPLCMGETALIRPTQEQLEGADVHIWERERVFKGYVGGEAVVEVDGVVV
jgi:hypothetical protein